MSLVFQGPECGSGMGQKVYFWPSDNRFHCCKQVAFALACLWQCDIINLAGLPILVSPPSSSMPESQTLLAWLFPYGTFCIQRITCAKVSIGLVHPLTTMLHPFLDVLMSHGPTEQ